MKQLKKCNLILLSVVLIGMLVGCVDKNVVSEAPATPNVYFFDTAKNKLFTENLDVNFLNQQTEDDKILFILNALSAGPKIATLPTVVEVPIQSANHDGSRVNIDFKTSYNELSSVQRIAARAMLVESLCELDFIEGVTFSIEGKPMTGANDKEIGLVKAGDLLTGILDPNQATSKPIVTLYFASADDMKLVPEQRRIELNSSVQQEKTIIEELIKGPQTEGLLGTIPAETIVKDVTVKDGICQVDLSFDLKSKFFTTSESKYMMIYSIVNTLTESSKINKVAFLVDGKKDIEFTKDIDLRETFVRNNKIIEKVK
ncbi:GerMN domain-containing protein [Cellulosilyticum ruminicola]|uniref:GerMN domain-containing protein n=1 Tax=Cellulosilyticum ruminicola TaxID=425254 RepID=UPI0006D099A5|nr:GerMN domain-containing protein [Cellulosilyticum ruminicola]